MHSNIFLSAAILVLNGWQERGEGGLMNLIKAHSVRWIGSALRRIEMNGADTDKRKVFCEQDNHQIE